MKIKHWMTTNPVTVDPETLIIDARKMMREKHIRRLPVVKKGKLVGIVTYRNIIEASPSSATSLSVHELNYLLLKLQVKDVMHKNPITVSPEDSVINVIQEGAKRGIGSFPVVDKGKLVGIVTETEVINALLNIFGRGKESSIISLENVPPLESIGVFRRLAEIAEGLKISILAMFVLPDRDQPGNRIYIRVMTKEIRPLQEAYKKAGFTLSE
ncbi:MAG: CBS and ACT domain-containing protein [Pseudomonadota bacterium]